MHSRIAIHTDEYPTERSERHAHRRRARRADGEQLTLVRSPLVTAVIPAINEERNIAWVLRRLPAIVDEVVLVDGNSTDATIAVARFVRPDIIVTGQQRPGKGAALRAGFEAASGEYVVMIDADGSMDPAEIPLYVDALVDGHDFVKGSRFMDGGGTDDMERLRRLGNWALLTLGNMLYGRRFTDLCYGFMAFRASALPRMELGADGFEIETEIVVRAVKADLRIAEVPSFELPRRYGESNLNTWRDGRRVLHKLVGEWRGGLPRNSAAPSPAIAPTMDPAIQFAGSGADAVEKPAG